MCVTGANVELDLRVGHLRSLTFWVDGRGVTPLHRAPWVNTAVAGRDDLLPVERYLSGDFLCAPFAANDVENGPAHGWSANSRWRSVAETNDGQNAQARFQLERLVCGAVVEKELRFHQNAPLLYQTHRFRGGRGALPVAHHAMTRMTAGGVLAFSPKRYACTSTEPLEPPGRHRLRYPAQSADLERFPSAEGGAVNLYAYPRSTGHEDFVTLVEADNSPLGWTAVLREAEDDIVFVLKNPKILPVTMLWFSNGGRDYSPWDGRHIGVLGIEDGCSAGHAGHRGSITANTFSDDGIATALNLQPKGSRTIRHIIGAIPRPPGWEKIVDIAWTVGHLRLSEAGGAFYDIPCDTGFLYEE